MYSLGSSFHFGIIQKDFLQKKGDILSEINFPGLQPETETYFLNSILLNFPLTKLVEKYFFYDSNLTCFLSIFWLQNFKFCDKAFRKLYRIKSHAITRFYRTPVSEVADKLSSPFLKLDNIHFIAFFMELFVGLELEVDILIV